MNNSFLTDSIVHNSTDYLSFRITDIGNTFILPPICILGVLMNLLNVIVLLQPDLKDAIFSFMLINSIADFLFLFICSFTFIIRCGVLCNSGYTYESKFFELYIYLFVGNSILLFSTLLDIVVSLNRLFSFSLSPNLIYKKIGSLKLPIKCLILILISNLIL